MLKIITILLFLGVLLVVCSIAAYAIYFKFLRHPRVICMKCGCSEVRQTSPGDRCRKCGSEMKCSSSVGGSKRRPITASFLLLCLAFLAYLAIWMSAQIANNLIPHIWQIQTGRTPAKQAASGMQLSPLTKAFADRFKSEFDEMFFGPIIVPAGQENVSRMISYEGMGFFRNIPGEKTKVIMFLYRPDPPESCPSVQLRIGYLASTPSGSILPEDGDPIVLCSFWGEQAKQLVKDGVPPSLIDKLVEAANQAEWEDSEPGIASKIVIVAPE